VSRDNRLSVRVTLDPEFAEVDISGTEDDYVRMAALLRQGAGTLDTDTGATGPRRQLVLSAVRVSTVPGSALLVHPDTPEEALLISGDLRFLTILADNVASVGSDERGGHLHIEYFEGHAYLADGSAPLIFNSPHGSMPGDTSTTP
jgi:hypothetical protein